MQARHHMVHKAEIYRPTRAIQPSDACVFRGCASEARYSNQSVAQYRSQNSSGSARSSRSSTAAGRGAAAIVLVLSSRAGRRSSQEVCRVWVSHQYQAA
jgi:hypothetical protein